MKTKSHPLVILQPGNKLASLAPVEGDFSDWVLRSMEGSSNQEVPVVKPHDGDTLPEPQRVASAIVTGSSAMVGDDLDWIEPCVDWLRQMLALERPLLGICFGHQLLAHALGGEVRDNPKGIEVGTVQTRLTPAAATDPLFRDLPVIFPVQASHRQSVIQLPPGAQRLASSDKDSNHAFRYGNNAWGIQFHPEFDREITRAYIDYYRPDLEKSDVPVDRMIQDTSETELPSALLERFAQQIVSRQ